MTTNDTQKSSADSAGTRPSHRVWLVMDSPTGENPSWNELTGLWPTRKGNGLSGKVNKPVTLAEGFLTGRIVILPARLRPDQPDQEQGDADQGHDAAA
jgi:hypothetical protein